ncbi:MAG: (d)CMP kinase [Actinobacteria bacterium]|nr:(d)CMP kinase [Actinomycetota bacterium]
MTAVVAIDGPAGSGKSTIARALARRLGVPHVDTGAFYRVVTLAALRDAVDPTDAAAVVAMLDRVAVLVDDDRVVLDGDDVTDEIRSEAVTANVSAVARHRQVRARLVQLQRSAVGPRGAVVEGRDAATVIVPDATLKVWLTAPQDVRAARRAAQQGSADAAVIEQVATQLIARDHADREHTFRAGDAIEIDTGDVTVVEVVDHIVAHLPDDG